MNFRTCALAVACASLFGCSSAAANKAPVVDSVEFPDSATAMPSGSYMVPGTITFHDDDDTVKELHLQIVGQAMVITTPFPQQVMSGKAPLTLTFTPAVPSPGAVVNYEISVVDARSLESAKVMKSITLQ
jgi:hypothetical protein